MSMKIGKHHNRIHKADNRGVSFVEVVVAMLILAIAVIPLLGCFMMTLRINLKSRQSMAGTIVAQNVMECVKECAALGNVVDVKKDGTGTFAVLFKDLLPASYGTPVSVGGFDGFVLDNVQEGNQSFRVEVEYNQSTYQQMNEREMPDISALKDSESTVVVCPGGVLDGTYETEAAEALLRQWERLAENQMNESTDEEEKELYRERLEKAAISEQRENTFIPLFRACLTSELRLRLEQAQEKEVRVVAELVYSMDVNRIPSSHRSWMYFSSTYWSTYTGYYYSATATKNPAINVYVFYDPTYIVGTEIQDKIRIDNPTGEKFDLYLAVQKSNSCINSYFVDKDLLGWHNMFNGSNMPEHTYSTLDKIYKTNTSLVRVQDVTVTVRNREGTQVAQMQAAIAQ